MTRRVASHALADARADPASLDAIGITNQRETVVAWDPRTGEPVHNALVWQDRRTAARCDELREAGHEPLVRERTGLVLDPYFSGTKIEWLLRNVEEARDAVFGTIDSWLVFKLTGRHATDLSNASRTMLFDIGELPLGPRALRAARRRSRARCPSRCRRPGSSAPPRSSAARSRSPGSPATSRRRSSARPATRPGMAKNTYGTGSFVLLNAGDRAARPRPTGLLTTIAWGLDGRDRPTRSRRRCSSPARRSSGCATGSGSSPRRPRPRAWRRRSSPTTTSTSSRR